MNNKALIGLIREDLIRIKEWVALEERTIDEVESIVGIDDQSLVEWYRWVRSVAEATKYGYRAYGESS